MDPNATASGRSSSATVNTEAEQDLEILNGYLTACCFTMLDVSKDTFHHEIHIPENQKIIKTFAAEKNQKSLVVSKTEVEVAAAEPAAPLKSPEAEPEKPKDIIGFSLEVAYHGANTFALAFLKREQFPVLDLSSHDLVKPIASQIQVINIGYIGEDNTPFVLTNTYIQNSFAPLFHSFEAVRYPKGVMDEEEKKKSSGTMGLDRVHLKLSELSLAILQCQQNLDIPDVQLSVDPEVRAIVKKAKSENRKPASSDFEEKIKNKEFLDSLQYRVNQWIKEIRKVTKLDRDVNTGSALQEVNFWLNLEKVL